MLQEKSEIDLKGDNFEGIGLVSETNFIAFKCSLDFNYYFTQNIHSECC